MEFDINKAKAGAEVVDNDGNIYKYLTTVDKGLHRNIFLFDRVDGYSGYFVNDEGKSPLVELKMKKHKDVVVKYKYKIYTNSGLIESDFVYDSFLEAYEKAQLVSYTCSYNRYVIECKKFDVHELNRHFSQLGRY